MGASKPEREGGGPAGLQSSECAEPGLPQAAGPALCLLRAPQLLGLCSHSHSHTVEASRAERKRVCDLSSA